MPCNLEIVEDSLCVFLLAAIIRNLCWVTETCVAIKYDDEMDEGGFACSFSLLCFCYIYPIYFFFYFSSSLKIFLPSFLISRNSSFNFMYFHLFLLFSVSTHVRRFLFLFCQRFVLNLCSWYHNLVQFILRSTTSMKRKWNYGKKINV